MPDPETKDNSGLVLSVPILNRMKNIKGWLAEDEADLLIAACSRSLFAVSNDAAVVEVGSFCGRSTVVLASVVQSLRAPTKVYAVDPHEGIVGATDSGTQSMGPTFELFSRNIAENGLTSVVEPITRRSVDVPWRKPIAFLFIDGLHDYENVSQDFRHFEPWVVDGGYIAFHDYSGYYAGVKTFVDEILSLPRFEKIHSVAKMIVIRKISSGTISRRDTAGVPGKRFNRHRA